MALSAEDTVIIFQHYCLTTLLKARVFDSNTMISRAMQVLNGSVAPDTYSDDIRNRTNE